MSFMSIPSTLIAFVLTLLPVRVLAQAPENVGTGTAAIGRIQDCSSGGNTCSITYPQIYCSADGETHFQDVTVPLTLVPANPGNPDPAFGSTFNPEHASRWVVFPKGWGVDAFRQGVFHIFNGPKRFVSMREGAITIRATDGEERTFKKGDIFEAVDLVPCKGRLSKSEDGAVALFTDHP